MLRWLRFGAGWWLVFFPLYLLVTGSVSGDEILAGALLAAVAALAVTATQIIAPLYYRPRLRWLGEFRRLPVRVLVDCFLVVAALVGRRNREGIFRTIPFDPGGDDAESAARRALVTAGICLAPNTYVVAVDAANRRLLLHQLVPSAQPPGRGDREWPL